MSDRRSKNFNLVEFPTSDRAANLKISGNIMRCAHTLSISYNLYSPEAKVLVPERSPQSMRKHNLWEETCFEFFLRVQDAEPYWEFNLSPSGHWNVYYFEGYRQGMREEVSFNHLPFEFCTQLDGLSLRIELNLESIIPLESILEIAVSTVAKFKDGNISYWALVHPAAQADFHDCNSFIIEI